jgi:hypothetical protein
MKPDTTSGFIRRGQVLKRGPEDGLTHDSDAHASRERDYFALRGGSASGSGAGSGSWE